MAHLPGNEMRPKVIYRFSPTGTTAPPYSAKNCLDMLVFVSSVASVTTATAAQLGYASRFERIVRASVESVASGRSVYETLRAMQPQHPSSSTLLCAGTTCRCARKFWLSSIAKVTAGYEQEDPAR